MPISGFLYEGPSITVEDIHELETALSVEFPQAYRDLLLRCNGGRPVPEDTFGEGSSGSLMSRFYAVKHERESLTIAHKRKSFEGRIPDDLLPIAMDMGGSQVCMGIRPQNHGQIYFWANYDEPRPGDAPRSNISLLADDFVQFLDTFREEIDDDDE